MARNVWNRVATPLAGVVAAALAVPQSAQAADSHDRVVYAVCYIFTGGGDHTATSFPPHKITARELYLIHTEAKLHVAGVVRANGFSAARLSRGCTRSTRSDFA